MDSGEGEKKPKDKERDVYSFPGDSDPESPPPAPWAHCTFIQRCKRKRVLLRPFSGLGTLKRALPESGKRARASPQKPKTAEVAPLTGGVYDFEEEPMKVEAGGGAQIYTCVECSIYFKKQVHLQEHMVEHCQGTPGGGRRSGKAARFRCVECGWNLPNRLALADHHGRHQESRLKILEEIEKLNENGKPRGVQKVDRTALDCKSPEQGVTQDSSSGSIPGPEMAPSPTLSPGPVSTPGAEPAAETPRGSGRPPAQTRGGYRRRFVCPKCNFSTRTPQALTNHSKIHNRKKPSPQAESPPLSCGLCAFLTPSQTVLRDHQNRVHPGEASTGGERSSPNVGASEPAPEPGSLPDAVQGKTQRGAAEDSVAPDGPRPPGRGGLNRRFTRRGKTWTHLHKFYPSLDDNEERRDDDATEWSQREVSSPRGEKPQTRARSSTGETGTGQTTN